MSSLARQGIDRLLLENPDADVLRISFPGIVINEPSWHVAPVLKERLASPWVMVTLGHQTNEPLVWHRHEYAIWRETGNVYRVGPHGTVDDDPLYEVTATVS